VRDRVDDSVARLRAVGDELVGEVAPYHNAFTANTQFNKRLRSQRELQSWNL